ncbi:hypothetical protein STEG23_030705, partial [Scotinomys teguina]
QGMSLNLQITDLAALTASSVVLSLYTCLLPVQRCKCSSPQPESSQPIARLACLQCDSYFMGLSFLEVERTVVHVVHLEPWVSAN